MGELLASLKMDDAHAASIKAYITPKVGVKGGWNTQAEHGVSTMKSGFYATSFVIPTFTQQSAMQKGV